MPPGQWAGGDLHGHRERLAISYQELLNEFSSSDLRSVGNYNVGRLIGKGSFGKVYLASHKLTNGSKVVLKSAKKDDQNLTREIHHHRQFIHPHIARLYEVIVTESLVWLVLEWCPGDELYNHLLQHGRMDALQVQKIFTQLVGAVTYVHNKGCVHRDLKLENILLDRHGNVKLVDFGFTRDYSGTSSYLQTWCGTIAYSAPEMIKGEKYAGEKVDVWSLGIILYALLVGELPYDDDDDNVTKQKILKEEPKYPDTFPDGAKDLVSKLLSKRPLLRPTLPDILRHSWLSEHAPQQQEILKLQQPPPFSTQLEKETLARMRSAGVDVDMVVDHVLAQRCDSLAGWWALLMEKEDRKAKRKDRKRKEKEREEKALKRLSAASARLLGTPSLREINEEGDHSLLAPGSRGRHSSRPNTLTLSPELPKVAEQRTPTPEPPRATTKDPARSTSSTRRRPLPPPKESYQHKRPRPASRHSSQLLRTLPSNGEFQGVTQAAQKHKKLYHMTFRDQLASIKSWFRDSTRRTMSTTSTKKGHSISHVQPLRDPDSPVQIRRSSTAQLLELRKEEYGVRPELQTRSTVPARPHLSTASSYGSNNSGTGMTLAQAKRLSMSPQPLTPRSASYRRRSGLGRRKSTSSSISSVRSFHITHPSGVSHSKASSTSSASASIASPNPSNPPGSRSGASPHSSVKALPASPGTVTLPAGIRVQRRGPGSLGGLPSFDLNQHGAGGGRPSSPGMHAVFARQKRKVFKGPTNMAGGSGRQQVRNVTPTTGSGASTPTRDNSRKRQSVEIVGSSTAMPITEEEEEEPSDDRRMHKLPLPPVDTSGFSMNINGIDEDDEDIEEVDAFSPVESGDEKIMEWPSAATGGGFTEDGEDGYFRSVHPAEIHMVVSNGDADKGMHLHGKGKQAVEGDSAPASRE